VDQNSSFFAHSHHFTGQIATRQRAPVSTAGVYHRPVATWRGKFGLETTERRHLNACAGCSRHLRSTHALSYNMYFAKSTKVIDDYYTYLTLFYDKDFYIPLSLEWNYIWTYKLNALVRGYFFRIPQNTICARSQLYSNLWNILPYNSKTKV